jgi:type IV pilus assembly protein PilO
MTPSRTWTAGAAVVGVLLVIAGWFLLIAPQRSAAADLRDQTAAQQTANDQIVLRTKQLQAQFASLPARQAQLAEIKQQMPDNPALPSLIRDLASYAKDAGLSLESVSPADPVVVDATTGEQTPVAPGAAPAAGADGLVAIPTTVVASGTYADLTLYLQKLQTQMRRAYLVNSIKLEIDPAAAGATGSTSATKPVNMTVIGDIFVLNPDALTTGAGAPATAPTSPSAPAGSASSTTPAAN